MSYIVLARKYRPRTFSELVGQAHVVQALTNALTQQRLHHAYMFNGTRGVGKTTISRILAKSLNCQGADGQGGITATPCGVCQACTEIDAGVFVDYTELDAASNRGVDEVQTLLEQAVYKPVQGRFKVFMIDEVHMLTNTAFNAMLKTLEEPPEYLKFVLATTDPQKVPVTVLSRCLQFNLRPMPPDTVFAHLTHVLQAENIAAEAPALRLLARAARGSMRDALSLADQAIAFGSGKLEEAGVRQMLGSVDSASVFTLIGALAAGDARTVIETVDALRAHGLSADTTLEDMSSALQRMAVLQAVPQMAQEMDAGDPDAATIARLAQQMPADATQLLYSICLRGRADLGLAPDEYAALTMVLLRLLAFQPASNASPGQPQPETEKKNSALTERPAASAPSGSTQAETPTPTPASPVQTTMPATPRPEIAQDTNAVQQADVHAIHDPLQQQNHAPLPWEDDEPAPAPQTVAPMPSSHDELPQAPASAAIQAPATGTDSESKPSPQPPEKNDDGDFWHATVQQLIDAGAITAMPRELALHSQLVQRTEDRLLLRVQRETLAQPGICARLQQALAAVGIAGHLEVQSGTASDTPAMRNASAARAAQRAAEQCVASHPVVRELIREWDATIVPGSIRPL